MNVKRYTKNDAAFFQYLDEQIFVGDVVDRSVSENMSAGYYRNDRMGAKNEWIVTYDEILVVISGALTIRSEGDVTTARPGEIIYLKRGTALAYEAGEDNTEAVYVTYPHWFEAQHNSAHADLLESFHPVDQTDRRP